MPQQSRDTLSRTIADANPNDFRRRARQDAQAVKVFVFRDENASRSRASCQERASCQKLIRRAPPQRAELSNVERVWKDVQDER